MRQIKDFIASLQMRPELRQELAANHQLQKHAFYLQLAYRLAPAFPPAAPEVLDQLTGNSYLYFRFLLGIDALLDEDNNQHSHLPQHLFSSLTLHEQAVRGLAHLFPTGDDFWVAFEECKQEYMTANLHEKQLATQRLSFSVDIFNQIAAGKSAVCYAMAHALASLTRESRPVAAIGQCLRQLHIGAQYLDDVQDFRQDWEGGQFTLAHFLVEEYLRARGIAPASLPAKQVHQYFYTSGIAQHLLQQGQAHYGRSLAGARELGLTELAEFLHEEAGRCRSYQQEIDWLLQKTAVKARKSVRLLHAQPPALSASALQQAIRQANQHLRGCRDAQGRWTDFMTSAGPSTSWATAYAGLQLAETVEGFALAHEAFDGSFSLPASYNESIAQDGDSLSFAMGLRRKVWGEPNVHQVQAWLAYMNADGGWATYRHADQLRHRLALPEQVSVAAWLSPQPCVTAAAAYVLRLHPELAAQYRTSCAYLARQQQPAGYWSSYWWSSPVYATAFAVLALAALPEYAASCQTARNWLVEQQQPEGAWHADPPASGPSAFFTALALQALLTHPLTSEVSAIAQGVAWLLGQQTTDGSWLTTRILRIPATDVLDPATVQHWRGSSFGVNVLVDDHNRVFTTSTVLHALSAYGHHESAPAS